MIYYPPYTKEGCNLQLYQFYSSQTCIAVSVFPSLVQTVICFPFFLNIPGMYGESQNHSHGKDANIGDLMVVALYIIVTQLIMEYLLVCSRSMKWNGLGVS